MGRAKHPQVLLVIARRHGLGGLRWSERAAGPTEQGAGAAAVLVIATVAFVVCGVGYQVTDGHGGVFLAVAALPIIGAIVVVALARLRGAESLGLHTHGFVYRRG